LSLQIFFALLIIVSNSVVLVVFLKVRTLIRGIGRFLLILALVDLSMGFVVIFQVLFFFYPALSAGKWSCMVRYLLVVCMTQWSLMTLLVVSLERYVSMRHARLFICCRERHLWVTLLLALWLYVLAFVLYPLAGPNH
jgi:hypothetical protein